MTTQQAVVAVLGAAILANIVLAIALIIWPGIRVRRQTRRDEATRPITRSGPVAGAMGPGAVAPGGPGAGRPIPVGPGAPGASRYGTFPADPARAGGWLEATGSGGLETAKAIPTDPVTGLELAPAWSKWLAEEAARMGRYGRPATVILVEVAGLDRLAERFGPEAVDRLIPPIATTMRRNARASDNIARLGKARFGALLPETDEIRAINYIERARSACDVWLEAGAVAVRLSIGWAEIGADKPVAVAIQTAERRLNEERQRQRGHTDTDADSVDFVGSPDAPDSPGSEARPDN